jgi:hypothetical protein
VLRIALAFVDIALHRRGPDTLPASRYLLGIVVAVCLAAAYFALNLAPHVQGAGEGAVAYPPILIVIERSIYAAFIWVLLKGFNRERRFLQTATAAFGADALFTLMSLPILSMSGGLESADGRGPVLLSWLVFLWSIDVAAFVLSRALEQKYTFLVMIMLGYVLSTMGLRPPLLDLGF